MPTFRIMPINYPMPAPEAVIETGGVGTIKARAGGIIFTRVL
jgi:hypothetical protein